MRKLYLKKTWIINGIKDKITQIRYEKPAKLISYKNSTKRKVRNGHFLKLLLYRNNAKKGQLIFNYFIGDDESKYWVYKIEKSADINQDNLKDLLFYAGDDTTEEYVFLIQKQKSFKTVHLGIWDIGHYELDKSYNIIQKNYDDSDRTPKLLAKWNSQTEVFEGLKLNWTTKDCYQYKSPNKNAEKSLFIYNNEIVLIDADSKNTYRKWQKINSDKDNLWINKSCISKAPIIKNFK